MTAMRLMAVALGMRIAAPKAMKGLSPANRMITGKVLAAVLAVLGSSGVARPVATSSQRALMFSTPPSHWEQNLRRMPLHISEFVPVSEPVAWLGCGDVRPPVALLTPDPMLQFQDDDLHVRISFIVGSDGRVHSPFILDSGGAEEDELIMRAVRRWRYRPALCNGVATDSEARVRFGRR